MRTLTLNESDRDIHFRLRCVRGTQINSVITSTGTGTGTHSPAVFAATEEYLFLILYGGT